MKEGWRPLSVQAEIYAHHRRSIASEQVDLNEEELDAIAARYVATPSGVPPHSTGGAVDVVLSNRRAEADMGSPFNDPHPASQTAAAVDGLARRNRMVLSDALGEAGFINYPYEWWHWSWGDRYWGHANGEVAVYGGL